MLVEGMNTARLLSTDPGHGGDPTLRLAVAAYLARYKGQSRLHTESDLRAYLAWCRDHDLDPLRARRPHVELYLRWMQEARGFAPSTVSRRLSVLAGFYRTCVIDTLLEHSPAEHVRRPHVPVESPTLGLSHLQFEALLTASRDSANVNDFALVAMLGLLGLRIFEATGADVSDLSEVHGHRVLTVLGKGDRLAVVPLPPAVARAVDRATEHRPDGPILRNRAGRRMSRHSATRRLRALATAAGVSLDVAEVDAGVERSPAPTSRRATRLAQVFADAVHDGLVAKSPCSRRTSPTAGKQRPYVCTTEQMWALHDAMPRAVARRRPARRVRRSPRRRSVRPPDR